MEKPWRAAAAGAAVALSLLEAYQRLELARDVVAFIRRGHLSQLEQALGKERRERLLRAVREVEELWKELLLAAMERAGLTGADAPPVRVRVRAPSPVFVWGWDEKECGLRAVAVVPRGEPVTVEIEAWVRVVESGGTAEGRTRPEPHAAVTLEWQGGRATLYLASPEEPEPFLAALLTLGDPRNRPFWEAVRRAAEEELERAKRGAERVLEIYERLAPLLRTLTAAGGPRREK